MYIFVTSALRWYSTFLPERFFPKMCLTINVLSANAVLFLLLLFSGDVPPVFLCPACRPDRASGSSGSFSIYQYLLLYKYSIFFSRFQHCRLPAFAQTATPVFAVPITPTAIRLRTPGIVRESKSGGGKRRTTRNEEDSRVGIATKTKIRRYHPFRLCNQPAGKKTLPGLFAFSVLHR